MQETRRTRHNTDVFWAISVFDPSKKPLFPLPIWHFFLDWRAVPEAEDDLILSLISRPHPDEPVPATPEDIIVSISANPNYADPRILKFRKYFKRESLEEHEKRVNRSNLPEIYFYDRVFLDPNYAATPNGEQISRLEMQKLVTGHELVLADDPQTFLSAGACAAKDTQFWTTDTANTIDHYLKLCLYLHRASWINAPVQMFYKKPSKEQFGEFTGSRLPHWEQVASVAAFFRQLCFQPDLAFENACNCYMRHASDQKRVGWIKMNKKGFRSLLESDIGFGSIKSHTRGQLLELLLYGTHLLHSKSEKGADATLIELCKNHHSQEIVATIQFALRDILNAMTITWHVISLDFRHWLDSGMAKPTNPDLLGLFDGSPPDKSEQS